MVKPLKKAFRIKDPKKFKHVYKKVFLLFIKFQAKTCSSEEVSVFFLSNRFDDHDKMADCCEVLAINCRK